MSYLLCLLLLIGASEAWMNGGPWLVGSTAQETTALDQANIHKAAVIQAYVTKNETAIDALLNRHGLYLPLYLLHDLNLLVARIRNYNENYAFGKYNGNMYLMHLDRKDTSSTGWYMSRLIECEKNIC